MINGTIKARVVLMFLGNPSFVSGQAGVVAASLCLGVPLRCPSSSAKVERVVPRHAVVIRRRLNASITVTADCRRIFAPSAILSVIGPSRTGIFSEKPIHLRRLDDRSPAWHGSSATAGKVYNYLLLTDHFSRITANQALTAEDAELDEALVLLWVEL